MEYAELAIKDSFITKQVKHVLFVQKKWNMIKRTKDAFVKVKNQTLMENNA